MGKAINRSSQQIKRAGVRLFLDWLQIETLHRQLDARGARPKQENGIGALFPHDGNRRDCS
jgi:hypothetical protein